MLDSLIRQHFTQDFSVFQKIKHIMKIDIAKLVMLYVYGGMYVDMDFYCIENFHNDLVRKVALSGSHHTSEDVQNGLIAAEAGNPFIKLHIEDQMRNLRDKSRQDYNSFMDYVKYTTGPNALGLTYFKNMAMKDDIQILDPCIYNPLVSSFYHENEMKGVKCIHLLTGIWGRDSLTPKKNARAKYEDWRKIKIDDI